MSTKKSLTPLIIILLGLMGIVSAGSLMSDLPDTPEFPRTPTATGTLGYVLGLFGADGTAPNTAKLGGRYASGYLQNTYCADSVWNGINPDGTARCKQPLLAFAEIYEGTMQINGTTKGVGTKLYEGDKIETNATQTGTIRFTSAPSSTGFVPDISVARLATNSTVFIDRGDTAGTLALITLEDGLLWGRVLTSTGIDFAGAGVIAGVRGTSIRMWRDKSISQTRIAVIDSASPNPTMLRGSGGTTPQSILPTGLSELNISTSTTIPTTLSLTSEFSPSNISPLAQWTQSNLRADLDYLITLRSTSSSAVLERLNAEIGSLTQSGNTAIQSTFEEMACADAGGDSTLWRSLLDQGNSRKDSCRQGVLAYADFTQNPSVHGIENVISLYTKDVSMVPMTETGVAYVMDKGNFNASLYGDTSAFPKPKNRVWTLATYNEWPVCQKGDTISGFLCGAIQGFMNPGGYSSVYMAKDARFNECDSGGSGLMCSYSGLSMRKHLAADSPFGKGNYTYTPDGIKITGTGYLSYPLTQLTDEIGSLAGKTIEIEFDSLPTSGVLLDLGDNLRISRSSLHYVCVYGGSGYINGTCETTSGDSPFILDTISKPNTISIKIKPISSWYPGSASISRITIGNNKQTNYIQAVSKTIKKIDIF